MLRNKNPPKTKDESLIPEGVYCYEILGPGSSPGSLHVKNCPYWDRDDAQLSQEDGYCHFLERSDWEDTGMGMLWDQCKECGINNALEDDELEGST